MPLQVVAYATTIRQRSGDSSDRRMQQPVQPLNERARTPGRRSTALMMGRPRRPPQGADPCDQQRRATRPAQRQGRPEKVRAARTTYHRTGVADDMCVPGRSRSAIRGSLTSCRR
jgi:hypothetical protein